MDCKPKRKGNSNRQRHNNQRTQQHPEIHIGQINAQNSVAVLDELRGVIYSDKMDIIAIQEPFSRNNAITGLGAGTKIVTDTKKFTNVAFPEKIKTAIAIANPNFNVLKIEQLSNTHFICVEVSARKFKLYVVSAYFQYCDKIEPYIQHLDAVLHTLQGCNVIICADANAKSTLWHSSQTDERGEALENLIAQHNLFILNRESNARTYDSTNGAANIDVTLASSTCYNKISHWTLHQDRTTSDHNLITLKINTPTDSNTAHGPELRYNIRRADWTKFEEHLKKECENVTFENGDDTPVDPDAQAITLQQILKSACDAAIPRKTRYPKSVPWWNKDLTKLKTETRRARRSFQSEANKDKKELLKTQYKTLRNKYIAQIRKAKSSSWQEFVTREGNSEPWSIVYKFQTNKIQIEQAQESIKSTDRQTTTWTDTAQLLLEALIPGDNPAEETPWHSNIRNETQTPPDTEDTPPFEAPEIGRIIRRMKNKKAPGHDLLETEVIKRAWPIIEQKLTTLMNNCLKTGKFPLHWKQGVIRVLLKGKDKDKTDPKSYRPICLLPVLSKILEKLLAQRLEALFHHHPLSSKQQFGFKKGKSTEDAIVRLRQKTDAIDKKYAIAMFFDISGAFDSVWWPGILHNLKKRNCPRNLYKVTQNYLQDRTMCIKNNDNETVTKAASKGCPQGSILGPNFWNLNFDDAINTVENAGYEVTAYADDKVVIVAGNSRMEIEKEANHVAKLLSEWCTRNKMQLSKTKSEMLLIKGFLDIKRPPTVKIEGKSLKMVPTAKYLGIHFGTRLNITPHINSITNKTKQIFSRLAHVAKAHWGINYKNMHTLYRGVFISIITYAAAGWSDKINAWHKRKLIQAQRHALLRVTRGYRTISNDALTILAAATPIDLLLAERRAIYLLKHNLHLKIGNVTYSPTDTPMGKDELNELTRKIKKETNLLWQSTWEQSPKGRITKMFFNSVENRMKSDWINLTFSNMQLLTGHGQINDYQKLIFNTSSGHCLCNAQDSVEHILFECPDLAQYRIDLIQITGNQGLQWPPNFEDLVNQQTFGQFSTFATKILKHRKQQNINQALQQPTTSTRPTTTHLPQTTANHRITRAKAKQRDT